MQTSGRRTEKRTWARGEPGTVDPPGLEATEPDLRNVGTFELRRAIHYRHEWERERLPWTPAAAAPVGPADRPDRAPSPPGCTSIPAAFVPPVPHPHRSEPTVADGDGSAVGSTRSGAGA